MQLDRAQASNRRGDVHALAKGSQEGTRHAAGRLAMGGDDDRGGGKSGGACWGVVKRGAQWGAGRYIPAPHRSRRHSVTTARVWNGCETSSLWYGSAPCTRDCWTHRVRAPPGPEGHRCRERDGRGRPSRKQSNALRTM